jgi:CRISPR-associated protein Csb1
MDLRSRCLLWPNQPLSWTLLGKPGQTTEGLVLDADAAIELFNSAVDMAKAVAKEQKLALPWRDEPLVLIPSERLIKTVVESQRLAIAQSGEADSDGGAS